MIVINLYKRLEFWILLKIWLIRFQKLWKNSIVKYGLFWNPERIIIEEYVYIWENCNFWGLGWITIASGTICWPNIIIRSSNHNYKSWDYLPYGPWVESRPVKVWKNCWIWDSVLIAPWTQIWEWVIIWMWSVVSWEIPAYSIEVWNPWKVIKTRDIDIYNTLKEEDKIYIKNKILWNI